MYLLNTIFMRNTSLFHFKILNYDVKIIGNTILYFLNIYPRGLLR